MSGERKSNALVEQVMLLEHWKNPVALLMKDEIMVIDRVMEIFLTADSLNKRMDKVEDKTGYTYMQIPVVKALEAFFQGGTACDGLSIQGLSEEELYITREDLAEIKGEVDTIMALMSVKTKEKKKVTAWETLQDKSFWIQGKLADKSVNIMEGWGFETVQRKGDDTEYIKLYLTKMNADEKNIRQHELNKYTFREFVKAAASDFGLVIEPEEEYGMEFTPEELKKYQNQ